MITIDDFGKVEIRVGTVLSAEPAEGADKLLRIVFDFGPLSENEQSEIVLLPELTQTYPGRHVRQIMSAIRPFFADPQVLVGKQICVLTNLEPRKFRGFESQGMLMAVGDAETGITFITPEKPVEPGMKVK
ncbi:MAG: hypothetical protein KGJ07_06605 [Patescibacteria group bacterium]|nr:hypothetical protein [Patescibacteria group bacterium]MDE2588047.1 hypothetical protein [Patescibacteria group bacterium]